MIVGENKNFSSFAEGVMAGQGVEGGLVQDEECINMMETFIRENKALWEEDIHEIDD